MPTEQPKELKGNGLVDKNTVHSEAVALTETMPNKEPKAETPNEALTPEELRRKKHREYMRDWHQKHKEKINVKRRMRYLKNRDRILERKREHYQENREDIRAKFKERYHSDPEFKEKHLNMQKVWWRKRQEGYIRFKIEYGGKCIVDGEDDLDKLIPHHPDGKEDSTRSFFKSREFTNWVRYGTKPNVKLMCANCHLKYEVMLARGEVKDLQDFLNKMGVKNGVDSPQQPG